MIQIGPGEGYHIITGDSSPANNLINRKVDLADSSQRASLLEAICNYPGFPFQTNELTEILAILATTLNKEWLTVNEGGIIALRIGKKELHGFYLFNHLIPLGRGLILLKEQPGFDNLLRKLNQPSYERLSSMLEAFTASRYVSAGYEVELEPKIEERKTPDFRVNFKKEWIYFECKRMNVDENMYVKKSQSFVQRLGSDLGARFKDRIPGDYQIDIRLDRTPNPSDIQELMTKLEKMLTNGEYLSWEERDYGKYGIMQRSAASNRPVGFSARAMQMTVETKPAPFSAKRAPILVSFNPFGKKLEQKFRTLLKEAKKQIPAGSRGILIIQGLDETKAMTIAQERIAQPSYQNIAAVVAIGNGVQVLRRTDQHDVDYDFIGTCVTKSIFYDYDLRNY